MKVTKHFFALAALLLALMLPGAAWADSVTYDFTGTLATPFNGNGTVTGQFTIDFSLDAISAFDFTTPYSEVTASNYLPILVSANGFIGLEFLGISPNGSANDMLLVFQTPIPFTAASLFTGPLPGSFAGYVALEVGGGSQVKCTSNFPQGVCSNGQGESLFESGSVVATTPEPSTLLLLGAGLATLLATLCRNRFCSQ